MVRKKRRAVHKKEQSEAKTDSRTAETNETIVTSFNKLPVDVIYRICTFLDDKSLETFVTYNCPKNFTGHRAIISLLIKRAKLYRLFWTASDRQRYSAVDHLKYAQNWSDDRWTKVASRPVIFREKFLIPRISLNDRKLWLSRGPKLLEYNLNTNGSLNKNSVPIDILNIYSKADITRFAVQDENYLAGTSDGHVIFSGKERGTVTWKAHKQDTHTVDIGTDYMISGSKDHTVALWKLRDQNSIFDEVGRIDMNNRVWNVIIHRDTKLFAVGTGDFDRKCKPITIWDPEKYREGPLISFGSALIVGTTLKRGAGITDMMFYDENTLLTTSYDTTCSLWDIRSGKASACFIDPYDTVLFSVASDHQNMIMVGSAKYSRVWIIDRRNIGTAIKRMQVNNASRPVYSLAFNMQNIYTALDDSLTILSVSDI